MRKLPEWVSIGYISRAHGIQGEVRVVPFSNHPDRFEALKQVKIESPAGEFSFVNIEKVRLHSKYALVKFNAIETRDQALALKGSTIQIKLTNCPPLPVDEFYHFDLIGLAVRTTEDEVLGEVTDILEMPANDVYVISDGSREILLPAIKEVVRKVDLKKEEIIIKLIDGLID